MLTSHVLVRPWNCFSLSVEQRKHDLANSRDVFVVLGFVVVIGFVFFF